MRVGCSLIAIFMLISACGCSSRHKRKNLDPSSPYFKYEKAMNEFVTEDYTQAATMFENIISTSLNPVLTQLATLRLGDSLFFQGRHAEAAEIYREFLDQYPRSPDAPHAAYMRGLSYLRKMPDDHFILPPAESREMSDVSNAYLSFASLIESSPDSYYALRARFLLARTVERKCRHHLYVARWYNRDGAPNAVIQRLEQALSEEEHERSRGYIPADFFCASQPGNLMMLAKAYNKTGNLPGLRSIEARFQAASSRFPEPESALATLRKMIVRH